MSVAFWIQFISPRDTLVGDSSPSCRCYLRIYVMGEEPGTVLSVNHEVFLLSMISSSHIAKFRLKLKKVGKTTRPFRCDLNQIPYDYTVEVRNTFKGLDLIECLMNYGRRFVTLYRRQGSRSFPWKRNAKNQNGCLGRPYRQL